MKSNNASARRRRGFSLMELLIVVAIILIIASVAIPRMNKAMMQAREMTTIRQIHTIHTGQTQYRSQFGHYAASLAELGPPASGTAGPAAADLLPTSITAGKKDGFVYALTLTPTGYSVTAVPEKFGSDGGRSFYSDESMSIRESWTADPATAQSPELGAGQQTPAAQ